jgi:hypothetical protein
VVRRYGAADAVAAGVGVPVELSLGVAAGLGLVALGVGEADVAGGDVVFRVAAGDDDFAGLRRG